MTTFIPLIPSNRTAQTFQATFDGVVYLCEVRWNLYGKRFFVKCSDSENNVIFNLPIIQTPASTVIQNLYWDSASLRAYVKSRANHKLKIGTVVRLVLAGTNPSGYNGEFDCNITSDTEFNFKIPVDPGPVISFGSFSFNINMIRGYFKTSSMIFRNNQFEINQ